MRMFRENQRQGGRLQINEQMILIFRNLNLAEEKGVKRMAF